MRHENQENLISCPRPEICAFLDGELVLKQELELEIHFEKCDSCAEELKRQQKFLIALNTALTTEKEIKLPADFTKTVVAVAESGVSGLRRPRERFNALFVCAGLFLFVILGLGSESAEAFSNSGNFLEQTAAVGKLALRFIYDAALGTTIILRSLCSQFVFKSEVVYSLLLILCAVSAFVFVRLMVRHKQV